MALDPPPLENPSPRSPGFVRNRTPTVMQRLAGAPSRRRIQNALSAETSSVHRIKLQPAHRARYRDFVELHDLRRTALDELRNVLAARRLRALPSRARL